MCDVQSMIPTKAEAGVMTEGFGVGLEVSGAYNEASSAKRALKSQAVTADMNARLLELGAQSALQAGERGYQQQRLKAGQIKAKQRTGYAAGNIDLGSETVVNVMTSSDVLGEINANQEIVNAAREAWGYRTESTNMINSARTLRAQAKDINPMFAAGKTLLERGSSFASRVNELDRNTSKASSSSSTKLPWQTSGNRRPAWDGGGYY